MLNRLKLKNFKAWREADLRFGKVTGFFGTNSAGKSSLIQLLLLLKQTRNATDRGLVLDLGGPSDLVNLGTFKDVIHRHDDRTRLGWLLDWTLPEKLKINDPMGSPANLLFEGDCLETRCEVGLRQARLWSHELAYRFSGVDFKLQPKPARRRSSSWRPTAENFRSSVTEAELGRFRARSRPTCFPTKQGAFIRMQTSLVISSWLMRICWTQSTILGPCANIHNGSITGVARTRKMLASKESGRWTRYLPRLATERQGVSDFGSGGSRSRR